MKRVQCWQSVRARCDWLAAWINKSTGGDSGRWEAACTSHAENRCALQPSSIWPPPQLAAWPALKSLPVLSPMWKTRPLNSAWPLYLYNETQKALTPPTPPHPHNKNSLSLLVCGQATHLHFGSNVPSVSENPQLWVDDPGVWRHQKQVLSRLDVVSVATASPALFLFPVCISTAQDEGFGAAADSWMKWHGSGQDPQRSHMK